VPKFKAIYKVFGMRYVILKGKKKSQNSDEGRMKKLGTFFEQNIWSGGWKFQGHFIIYTY